jgi:HAE1 family hydrophobic/amphiphilic exporter-1
VDALERWYGRRVAVTAFLLLSIALSAFILMRARLGPQGETGTRAFAVIVEHFGVDAREIERTVTRPLEDALSDVPGMKELRSTSEYGKSRVTIVLDANDRGSEAYLRLRDAVERVYAGLPPSVQKPRIISSSEGQRPVFIAAVRADTMREEELREWVEREVKPSFEKIPDAGEIEVGGGEVREIHVKVDPQKAALRGLSVQDVAAQIQRQNLLLPAGKLVIAGEELPITLSGKLGSIAELDSLALSLPNGGTAALSEIGEAVYGTREKESISRVNGTPMIVLAVKSSGNANLISFSRSLRAETAGWRAKGLSFDVILDRGKTLEEGICQIISSLLQGLAVVTLLLPLFVGDLRRLIVLSLSVPLTAVITVAILTLMGISLDQYILCGLAVGIGTIIDTGVIVGEQPSLREVRAITPSLFSSLVTTLIVLAPLFFLEFISPGIRQVALSIALLLLVSFAVNILFLPAFIHGARSPVRIAPLERLRSAAGARFKKPAFRMLYRISSFSLRFRWPVLGGTAVLVAAAAFGLLSVGRDFTPSMEEDSLYAHIELEPGATVESADERISRFARDVLGIPGVTLVETTARVGNGEMELRFSSEEIAREEVTALVRAYGERISGGFVYLPEGDASTERSMEVAVLGDDDELLKELAHRTASALGAQSWARQVVLNFKDPPPALIVAVDRQKAAEFGVSAADIAGTMRWALHGPVAVKWIENDREMDLRVMETGARTASRDSIRLIPVRNREGAVRLLSDLSDTRGEDEGGKIYRKNRQRVAFLTVHAATRNLDAFVKDLWGVLSQIELPKGYAFEIDRQVLELASSFSVLWATLALSVVFIFIVLAALSESLTAPLYILSILPPSLAFPLLAYRILGDPIRIPVLVGLIMLSGMVVNNSILIVDEFVARSPLGRTRGAALGAVRKRIRPLLITSMATVLGTVPLLFSRARGGTFMTSLAFVVFWGILGSLVSTLVVVPAMARFFPGGSGVDKEKTEV